MLSQDDRRRLHDIESHLEADDPAFVARMRAPLGRRRMRLLFAGDMLLWMSVPLVGAVAGWVIAAVTVLGLTGVTIALWWRLQQNT